MMHPECVGGAAERPAASKPSDDTRQAGRAGSKPVAAKPGAKSGSKTGSNNAGSNNAGSNKSGKSGRRPALTSDHFSLTWRRADAARVLPVAIHRAPRLMMAVAKKLLPRAIDRNTVRRIAREAWRAVAVRHPDLDLFVRLQSRPGAWSTLPDGQRKRACRAELDGLLARLPAAGGAG